MQVKDAVVKRFANICRQTEISYNELACRAGVTPSSVYSMMSSSRRDVSLTLVKKLCDGLEMSLADFFNSEEFTSLEQEIF